MACKAPEGGGERRRVSLYGYIWLLIALSTSLLSVSGAGINLGTAVNLQQDTNMTWTTQKALTLTTLTISSSTLTMDGIGIKVDASSGSITGKLYDTWTTDNMTWSLNGTGTVEVNVSGLTSGISYALVRDKTGVAEFSTASSTTVSCSCQLGSEHDFQLLSRNDPGDDDGGGGGGGGSTVQPDEPDEPDEPDNGDGEDDGWDTDDGDEETPDVTGEPYQDDRPASPWHPDAPTIPTPGGDIETEWWAIGAALGVPYMYYILVKKKKR